MPRATARKPRRPHRRTAANDAWGTPQPFFDALHAEFDFELDAAATPELAIGSLVAVFYPPGHPGQARVGKVFRTNRAGLTIGG